MEQLDEAGLDRQLSEIDDQTRLLAREIGQTRKAGQSIAALVARHGQLSERARALRDARDKLLGAQPPAPVPATGPPVVAVLTTAEQFDSLRGEWADLIERAAVHSVFSRWEWLHPWWQFYGTGKRLFLVTVRDHTGLLLGVAPLMLGGRRRGRRRPEPRTLMLVGTGEGPLANGLSLIVDPVRAEETTAAIWQACLEASAVWDAMFLDDTCPLDRGWLGLQACALGGPHLVLSETRRQGVYGELPATLEEYLASITDKKRRAYLRTLDARLSREFATVEYGRSDGGQELGQLLADLSDMSVRRFASLDRRSAWCDADFRDCVSLAATRLAEVGRLRINWLRLDGKTAAVMLGFVAAGAYQCFQPSFDLRFAEFGVSHCLTVRCIGDCIAEGLREFDFLAGEHDYKTRYFSGRRPVGSLSFGRQGPAALLAIGGEMRRRGWRQWLKARLGRTAE